MQRREILAGKKQLNDKGELIDAAADLEFIDEDVGSEEAVEGEIKPGEEANIVNIVTRNVIEKFGTDAKVLRDVKKILQSSDHVQAETVQSVKAAYQSLKEADYAAVLH